MLGAEETLIRKITYLKYSIGYQWVAIQLVVDWKRSIQRDADQKFWYSDHIFQTIKIG